MLAGFSGGCSKKGCHTVGLGSSKRWSCGLSSPAIQATHLACPGPASLPAFGLSACAAQWPGRERLVVVNSRILEVVKITSLFPSLCESKSQNFELFRLFFFVDYAVVLVTKSGAFKVLVIFDSFFEKVHFLKLII